MVSNLFHNGCNSPSWFCEGIQQAQRSFFMCGLPFSYRLVLGAAFILSPRLYSLGRFSSRKGYGKVR